MKTRFVNAHVETTDRDCFILWKTSVLEEEKVATMEDYYDRMDPDPSQGMFPSPLPRKITRHTTKTKAQGQPGTRSKDERRIRREKRAQRSTNRK